MNYTYQNKSYAFCVQEKNCENTTRELLVKLETTCLDEKKRQNEENLTLGRLDNSTKGEFKGWIYYSDLIENGQSSIKASYLQVSVSNDTFAISASHNSTVPIKNASLVNLVTNCPDEFPCKYETFVKDAKLSESEKKAAEEVKKKVDKKNLGCFVITIFEKNHNINLLVCVTAAADEKIISQAISFAYNEANKNADVAIIPMPNGNTHSVNTPLC